MYAEGERTDWLQTIAAQIMDGGAMPPSLDRLYITVPPKIMTRVSDGHCTAAAAFGEDRRGDKEAGWRVIIDEMVTLLREQGFVGGSDQALTWIKPLDGTWTVEMFSKTFGGQKIRVNFSIFGQRERRMHSDRAVVGERDEITGERVGTPSLFERGRMAPLELLVESSRGNVKPQKFEIHPLAALMPSYTEAERETLRTSIQRDGVRVPIVIYQKKILDGRNRGYFAAQFNKPVRITEFTGTEEEARRLVITLNVVRRHLTSAQQNLLANELFGEEAKKEAAQKRGSAGHRSRQSKNRPNKPLKIPTIYQSQKKNDGTTLPPAKRTKPASHLRHLMVYAQWKRSKTSPIQGQKLRVKILRSQPKR